MRRLLIPAALLMAVSGQGALGSDKEAMIIDLFCERDGYQKPANASKDSLMVMADFAAVHVNSSRALPKPTIYESERYSKYRKGIPDDDDLVFVRVLQTNYEKIVDELEGNDMASFWIGTAAAKVYYDKLSWDVLTPKKCQNCPTITTQYTLSRENLKLSVFRSNNFLRGSENLLRSTIFKCEIVDSERDSFVRRLDEIKELISRKLGKRKF